MELENITEMDFTGWLFCRCPEGLTLDEFREQIECDVTECAEQYGYSEDESGPLTISPFWLYMVSVNREHKRIKSLTRREYVREVRKAWEDRKERWRRMREG